jgi:hypothetical protein
MFATATEDNFVLPHHTLDLYEAYTGDKQYVQFPGDHHGARPDEFINSAVIFLFNVLQCD